MDKPEALRLADETVAISDPTVSKMYVPQRQILVNAAHELRRLHAENEQLKADAQELVAALELAYSEILVYRTPTQWSEYRNGALDMVKNAIEKHKGNL